MKNSQGEIKTWQTIQEEGKKIQWLVYFQLRLKKDLYIGKD